VEMKICPLNPPEGDFVKKKFIRRNDVKIIT
jgi:hypothetical protein